jgi:hypothetical protein
MRARTGLTELSFLVELFDLQARQDLKDDDTQLGHRTLRRRVRRASLTSRRPSSSPKPATGRLQRRWGLMKAPCGLIWLREIPQHRQKNRAKTTSKQASVREIPHPPSPARRRRSWCSARKRRSSPTRPPSSADRNRAQSPRSSWYFSFRQAPLNQLADRVGPPDLLLLGPSINALHQGAGNAQTDELVGVDLDGPSDLLLWFNISR